MIRFVQGASRTVCVLFLALLWLGVISGLHAYFNGERQVSNRVLIGYMPVISNLAAPLVDAASKGGEVEFEAMKFASFAEMGEAFRSGHIQVAFIIAPLAIAMHHQGVPLKVVYIGNRHESTMVVRKEISGKGLSDLKGRSIAVPMRFSGHYLAIKRYLRQQGLDQQAIRIEEIPPPDMAPALAAGAIDGYFVGEPFASKSLYAGSARRFLNVEDIWPGFICNLMIVRDDLIRAHPQWVQTLVGSAVRSGLWADKHAEEAVELASKYWGQDPNVVRFAFTNPPGRVRFDLSTPRLEELQEMAQEMVHSGLLERLPDLRGLVDDRFALAADTRQVAAVEQIMPH
jgi:NitT/TauT family transport system substrate-binding protein